MNPPPRIIAGRFSVLQHIARGGMGDVFLADDLHAGGRVAIKLLRRDSDHAEERFEREARVLQTLHHPTIVRYVAHGHTPQGHDYLAMEWLEGEPLNERISRVRMSHREAFLVARRVADALATAHEHGILHRDIKPSNVFLVHGDPQQAKLLDFGIARQLKDNVELTLEGSRVGTVAYMSPEQAWGRRDLDARSDVFSLGCLLFTCLTGRKPFTGEHATAILAKILVEEAPRTRDSEPSIPPALDALVARMLAKSPEHRPENGRAVVLELDALGEITGERARLVSNAPDGLTGSERRFVTVVFVEHALETDRTQADDGIHSAELIEEELRNAISERGGQPHTLANGTVLATFATSGSARDQAVRAARAALVIRTILPHATQALASGYALVGLHAQLGDAIDRGVSALRGHGSDHIVVDETTTGLIAERFDILSTARGFALTGEKARHETRRPVLGKHTTCVGRARELGTLEALFQESVSESVSRVAIVTAGPGMGKSRLRDELVSRLEKGDEDVLLLRATADDLRMGSAYASIGDAIKEHIGLSDADPMPSRNAKLRARLARVFGHDSEALEQASNFLGEICGAPAQQPTQALLAARSDPSLLSEGVKKAFEHWLTREARTQPVVFVLDDFQWGDAPSTSLLDGALRRLSELPLFVLVFARPEVHEAFPNLWVDRAPVMIPLPRLSAKASTGLIAQLLDPPPEGQQLERMLALADGSPFFLEELVRAWNERAELPATVVAMVQARLSALPKEARRVLRAASVFGMTFWLSGVRHLLGTDLSGEDLLSWLSHLESKELIEVRNSSRFHGEREFSVRHSLVREAAYAMLTDEDRPAAHAWTADWLAAHGETEPLVLAEHYEQGNRATEAATHYVAAAQRALAGHDLKQAVALGDAAIRCGAEGTLRGAARLIQAEAHRWGSHASQSAPAATEARAHSAPGSVQWFRATNEFVIAHSNTGDQQAARDAALEAATVAPRDAEALAAKAITLSRAAIVLEGTSFRSNMLWDAVDAIVDEIPGHVTVAHAWIETLFANRTRHAGRYFASMQHERAAFRSFTAAGDVRNAAVRRMNLGRVLTWLGQLEEALTELNGALADAEHLGLVLASAWATWALADLLVRLGRYDEARPLVEGLSERRTLGVWLRADIHVLQVMLAYRERRFEDACTSPSMPDELATNHWARARALAIEALARVELQEPAEARRSAEAAWAILEAHGLPDEGEGLVRMALVAALDAAGDRDEAERAERAALSRLNEVGESLPDEVRVAFVERIWEHHWIQQRAHAC